MPPFRRVDAERAGPSAVGILVPPGLRTVVIVRPRALAWDLLPVRWDGSSQPVFCHFERDEAAAVARNLQRDLEHAVARGSNPVETLAHPQGKGYQVWTRTESYCWIVCPRRPGQRYQSLLFATSGEAEAAAGQLARFLWPDADASQEYYYNTQRFSR